VIKKPVGKTEENFFNACGEGFTLFFFGNRINLLKTQLLVRGNG